MSSIRNLKKDINNVLGDVIEAVYIVEHANGQQGSENGTAIIDQAIESFDRLMAEVNKKEVENRKAHLKQVRQTLEKEATALVEQINKMV